MPDFMQIITQFGVPTGLLVWFLYDHSKTLKKIELAQQLNQQAILAELQQDRMTLKNELDQIRELCKK